jgi:hypothetical protein
MHAAVAPNPVSAELPNLDQQQAELAALVTRLTPREGIHPSAVHGFSLIRADTPSQPMPGVY